MPVTFTLDDLKRMPQRIFRAVTRGAQRWTGEAVNRVKRVAPVGATSNTRSAIRGSVAMHWPRVTASIIAPTKAASFTNWGTKPHGINPRKKKGLAFATATGMVTIFRGKNGRWVVSSSSPAMKQMRGNRAKSNSGGWSLPGRSGARSWETRGHGAGRASLRGASRFTGNAASRFGNRGTGSSGLASLERGRWISAGRSGGKIWKADAGHSGLSYRTTKPRKFAVWHPGTVGTRWFTDTIKAEKSLLLPRIEQEIARVLGR